MHEAEGPERLIAPPYAAAAEEPEAHLKLASCRGAPRGGVFPAGSCLKKNSGALRAFFTYRLLRSRRCGGPKGARAP